MGIGTITMSGRSQPGRGCDRIWAQVYLTLQTKLYSGMILILQFCLDVVQI